MIIKKATSDMKSVLPEVSLFCGLAFGIILGLAGYLIEEVSSFFVIGLFCGWFGILMMTADDEDAKWGKYFWVYPVVFSSSFFFVVRLFDSVISWITFGIFFFALMEIFFIIDREKFDKKNGSKFWFTVKKKLEAVLEVIIFMGAGNMIKKFAEWITGFDKWGIVLKVLIIGGKIIGALAMVVLMFYLYIKLNSLKYGNDI